MTRIGFGPCGFDPVERILGAPLAEILESVLVAPVSRRPSAAGPAVDVYPLALPDGEGALIPLGSLGEIGFFNDRGLLTLTVPMPMRRWVAERTAAITVRGPEDYLSSDGAARVVRLWVRLQPGMRLGLPVPAIGEIALEAR